MTFKTILTIACPFPLNLESWDIFISVAIPKIKPKIVEPKTKTMINSISMPVFLPCTKEFKIKVERI